MIRSFRHKGLRSFFRDNDPRKIRPDLVERSRARLSALHAAETLEAINLPGFNFHLLRGKPKRYSVHVNGPWCITFEWADSGAFNVDLEQYH